MTVAQPVQQSDDLVREHAYLVARGVRPLAIIGECSADTVTMMRAATRIEALSVPGAIPFVFDCKDGAAEYGYAAESWVVDLFEWLMTATRDAVPTEHRHHVLGLLLGYSPAAVREFQSHTSGRRFTEVRLATSE
jgi:hypothetical protein